MKKHVNQMITQGIRFSQPVIPAEREDRQRPVALVTLLFGHWRAPEVVG